MPKPPSGRQSSGYQSPVSFTHCKKIKLPRWQPFLVIFCNPHLRTWLLILGKGEVGDRQERERGRETSMWERNHRSVASCTYPNWGSNPQPTHVPWPESHLWPFVLRDKTPTKQATPARATTSRSWMEHPKRWTPWVWKQGHEADERQNSTLSAQTLCSLALHNTTCPKNNLNTRTEGSTWRFANIRKKY